MLFLLKLLIERIKKLSLNEIAFSGAKYADLIDNAIDHEDPDVSRVDPLKIPGISKKDFVKNEATDSFLFVCISLFTYLHCCFLIK